MSKSKRGGFTLVELVVVLAVIAIMSSVGISLVSGTSAIRADGEDKIAIANMNNIFTEVWGAESYAHPQTAADVKAVLASRGFEWREPKASDSEWWFGLSDGQMHIGKLDGDVIKFDYADDCEVTHNGEIIAAEGVLPDYLYMGSKYRKLFDDFNALDLGYDGEGSRANYAANRLNALLADQSYPLFMRKSLSVLAEHALFVGEDEAFGLDVCDVAAASEEYSLEIPTFVPSVAEEGAVNAKTIILFVGDRTDGLQIRLADQLKGCFAKSVYIPSDVTITEIEEGALDGSWIQRLLINADMPALTDREIVNTDIRNDRQFVVSVMNKYYPSELPAYEMDERNIDKFLRLYGGYKSSSDGFRDFRANQLVNSEPITVMYSEFYRLRPFERKFVTECYDVYPKYGLDEREPIYDNVNGLYAQMTMLRSLYDKVVELRDTETELLLNERHSFFDRLAEIKAVDSFTREEHNAMGERDKLFGESAQSSDSRVLEVNEVGDVVTKARGEADICVRGVLGDEIDIAYKVCGPYEDIDLNYLSVGGRKFALSPDGKGGYQAELGEIFGTKGFNSEARRITAQRIIVGMSLKGNYIHSTEYPRVSALSSADGATVDLASSTFAVDAVDGKGIVTVSATVASALDPNVKATFSIRLAGNTCNLFSSEEFEGTDKSSCGFALHSDITSRSEKSWVVPQNTTVYGNGHTFVNTTKSAQDSAWAQSNGEFRFPAIVTVHGTVKNLSVVAKKGSEIGLANRFANIAAAENGETESTLANLKHIPYVKGYITSGLWSGTGDYKGIFAADNKGKKYGPIELLSDRLAAVRVYGTGVLSDCRVEGGQYGVHLVGATSDIAHDNLSRVLIKNSLAANIYVSDNDGAVQHIKIGDVYTFNDSSMQPAFPMLIEPKVAAVSAKSEGMDRVWGYGMCLKYYYGLIEGKLSVTVKGLISYNKISKDQYYGMLYDNLVKNIAVVTDRVRGTGTDGELNLFKDNINDIVSRLELGNNFAAPITYGEQIYISAYDQQCVIADTGMRKSAASKGNVSSRGGFDSIVKGYNASHRAAKGVAAGGTNEIAVSYYAVPTIDGGVWNDNNLNIKSGFDF